MNRLKQLISDIEQYIDGCKPQTFSAHNIIVNRAKMDDYLAELRMCIPEIIERSEKIVDNKDAIIDDARAKAEQILNDATEKNTQMLEEHEIVQQAIQHGNEIISDARRQAQEILDESIKQSNAYKQHALDYTLNMMQKLCAVHTDNMKATKQLFEQHMLAMDDQYQFLNNNLQQFSNAVNTSSADVSVEEEVSEEAEEE